MKNVPDEIINGIINNWEKGILVKICDGGVPIWLSSKNIPIINNQAEIPVEYDRLSGKIDGFDVPLISACRSGMDISFGGGKIFISDFTLNLLNFDCYNEILEGINQDKSMVTVYLFYIHPGINYVQLYNAMVICNGVIDSVFYEGSTRIIIKCTGGDYFRHKVIPEKKITKKDYPFAPESSVGITIPAVYGSFSGTDLKLNSHNLIPAYCIDENAREYIFSKHSCKSNVVHCFVISRKTDFLSDVISNWSYTNSSSSATVKLTSTLKCEMLLQPKILGTQMSADYNTNYKNAVDDNAATSVTVQSNGNFYLKFDRSGNPGAAEIYSENSTLGYFKVCLSLGNVVNGIAGKAAKVKYYLESGFVYLNNYDIYASMSNSEISFLLYFPVNIIYDVLEQSEIGITVENGGSVELKNLFVKIKYFPG
jgi:hypothetical protein